MGQNSSGDWGVSMANQFREAEIPRLREVVGREELSGGLVLREIGGGLVRGLLSGESCLGGLVLGVDVQHSIIKTLAINENFVSVKRVQSTMNEMELI